MDSKGDEKEFLDKTLMDAMAYELYFKDELPLAHLLERMQGLEDAELIRRAMLDVDIQNTIAGLAAEKPFRIVSDATFKGQKRTHITEVKAKNISL